MDERTYFEALKRLEKKRTDLIPWYMFADRRITMTINGIKKKCSNCGVENPSSRVTCKTCHYKLSAGKVDIKELWKLNTELKSLNRSLSGHFHSKETKNQVESQIKEVSIKIKKIVERSNGMFKQNDDGSVVQAKAIKSKVEQEEQKEVRACPCCGEPCGGYFKIGHDGKVHGLLVKLDKNKCRGEEVKPLILEMWEIWKQNRELTMKQILIKAMEAPDGE